MNGVAVSIEVGAIVLPSLGRGGYIRRRICFDIPGWVVAACVRAFILVWIVSGFPLVEFVR